QIAGVVHLFLRGHVWDLGHVDGGLKDDARGRIISSFAENGSVRAEYRRIDHAFEPTDTFPLTTSGDGGGAPSGRMLGYDGILPGIMANEPSHTGKSFA